MNEYADLLRLPGTAEEQKWLREHLGVLSVKEGIALSAAMQRKPPATMTEAVNHLLTLDEYEVCPAGSYEQLGNFYLWDQMVPQEQQPFFDKTALGQWYESEHPGVLIGNCYVTYPEQENITPYDGKRLPLDTERPNWSVRLKMASDAVPNGVWVRLPDYHEFHEDIPGEISIALDQLQAGSILECTLLDARCVLPCIQDLIGQYDSLGDLIYDGQELGIILDNRDQGSPDFLVRYLAALEYEGCRRLSDAVNIANKLNDYDIISVDTFVDNTMQKVSKWACMRNEGVKNCFDCAAYAAALAEQQGYCLTDDGQSYIRKRDSPALEQRPSGMTMQ